MKQQKCWVGLILKINQYNLPCYQNKEEESFDGFNKYIKYFINISSQLC